MHLINFHCLSFAYIEVIQACAILHNLILQGPDWELDEDEEQIRNSSSADVSMAEPDTSLRGTAAGLKQRKHVMALAKKFREKS